MTPEAILADLVACADLPGRSNVRIADCVLGHLRRAGLEPVALPGPEGDEIEVAIVDDMEFRIGNAPGQQAHVDQGDKRIIIASQYQRRLLDSM